ncbi:MAG TPA: hypothetical protein VFR71_03490, partial [Methyloceanibacter sp.]|nr:hypothetical protein [Methyloceanibacter sp.]
MCCQSLDPSIPAYGLGRRFGLAPRRNIRTLTQDQLIIIAILFATIAMFLWGRWRHDMVAIASLLA